MKRSIALALALTTAAAVAGLAAQGAAAASGPHPSVVSFTATPQQLSHRGGSVQLTVRVRNGRRCSFAGQRRIGGGLVPAKTLACGSGHASLRLPVPANQLQTAGQLHFQVTVSGTVGRRASRTLRVRQAAAPPPLVLQTDELPGSMVGSAYTAPLTAIGGTAPYRWSVADPASLPPGVALGDGQLTGMPTASGRFTITVQVADADGQTASAALSLDVIPQLLTPPTAAVGSVPDQLSLNWSGYTLLGGPFSAVSGTFNVPTVGQAAGGVGITSEWVGIDGTGPANPSILQAGVDEDFGQQGASVFAWLELYPAPPAPLPMTVNAGDQVTVTLGQTSPGNWEVVVADSTDSESWTGDVSWSGPASSAEWIVEAPADEDGNIMPLAPFSPVTFSGLGVAGGGSQGRQVMVTQDGTPLATPSSLDPNGFSVVNG